MMRTKGFRFTPFGASKLGAVAGIICAGAIGYNYGSCYSTAMLGSSAQYWYLMRNRRSIISGESPFDCTKEQ